MISETALGGRVLFDGLNDFKNVIAPRRLEGRIRPVRTCDQEALNPNGLTALCSALRSK